MKKIVRKIIGIVPLAIIASMLIALPVLAYSYRAQVAVSENTSVSYDMLPIMWGSNNAWMADNGFMESTALDTRMQTLGGLNKPHMVTENLTLTAIPVPALSQTNLYFTTGESNLSAMDIIVGYNGYVSVDDEASLELSDNFTIEQTGWVTTTFTDNYSDRNLAYKAGAHRTYISGAGNITSAINPVIAYEYLIPDGEGDYTNIASSTEATHWEAVDDPPASPDDVKYVSTQSEAQEKDAYTLTNSANITGTDVIVGVTVYFRTQSLKMDGGTYTHYVQPYLRLGSDETAGTEIEKTNDAAFTTSSETLARPGGGSWTVADLNNLQAGIGLRRIVAGTTTAYCSQVYVRITFEGWDATTTKAIAPGVSSGEHTVTTKTTSDNSSLFFGIGKDIVNADFPLTNNLILNAPLWHTESDGSPFTTKDSYEHSCVVTDAVWSSTNGRYFDGINDKIVVANNPTLDITTGDFSFGCWASIDDITNYRTLANKMDASTPFEGWWFRVDITTGFLSCLLEDSVGDGFLTLTDDTNQTGKGWHLYSFSVDRDSATGWTILIDGVVVETGNPTTKTLTLTNTGDFEIGIWSALYPFQNLIGEVFYYKRCLATEDWLQMYNASKWKYETSDEYFHYNLLPAGGVSDNESDWAFIQNNVMPYADNITIWVGGSKELWFEPNNMIIDIDDDTATLPDRATSVANNGVIHWGTNPAGVGTSVGSMSSSGQPSIGVTPEVPSRDLLPEVGATDWYVEPDVTGSLLTNPFRPFVTMVSDNTTLTELQTWRWLGIAIVFLITGMAIRAVPRHLAIACTAAGLATVAMVVLTIWPLWTLVLLVLYAFGGWISERSPSV